MPTPGVDMSPADLAEAETVTPPAYDAAAGCPAGMCPQTSYPDYAANPTNPATPAAPCKNLKR